MSVNSTSANVSENADYTKDTVYDAVLFGKPLRETITLEDGSTTVAISVPMIYKPDASNEVRALHKWESSDARRTVYDKLGLTDSGKERREEFENTMIEVKKCAATGTSNILCQTIETKALLLLPSESIADSAEHFVQLRRKYAEHQTDPLFQDETEVVWLQVLDLRSAAGEAIPTS